MKKLLTLMLGLTFALGSITVCFGDEAKPEETKKTEKKKKPAKKKAPKKEEKKEGTR